MAAPRDVEEPPRLSVENVGGIDQTTIDLEPGVNVLTGRNASNRTSTLQAIMAALGSDEASLKADAEEGNVELAFEGRVATRSILRKNGTLRTDGEPLLQDSTLADLFAFLLEGNDVRRAVERGDDLRDLILRPVDVEQVEAEIDRLGAEKREITDELSELDDLESRRTELRERESQHEDRLEELRSELEETRRAIDDADAEVTEGGNDELEAKLEELGDLRSTLEDVRFNLETERESKQHLQTERDDLHEQLVALADADEERIEELDEEIERLRRRERRLTSDVSELQGIVQFNREMLEDYDAELMAALSDRDGDGGQGDPTDRLLEDGTDVTCWTCGNAVDRAEIESMTERISAFQGRKREERSAVQAELEELTTERKERRDARRDRERLETQIERVEAEIAEREERIETGRGERDELEERLEATNEEVESLRSEEYDELLDLHRRANELEVEADRVSDNLSSVRDELATLEERLGEREELRERREEISAELEERRTRVERIERDAIEAFNEHMTELLQILEYDNLDRVWLERTEREVREGRRKLSENTFDLHVVRSTESGTAYEDTIDHLSESEREVTGLVFALAGYLVHDVHERVPFLLLDSLEAIDSERIADVVEYLEPYATYVVVALLPEDASALRESYNRITDI